MQRSSAQKTKVLACCTSEKPEKIQLLLDAHSPQLVSTVYGDLDLHLCDSDYLTYYNTSLSALMCTVSGSMPAYSFGSVYRSSGRCRTHHVARTSGVTSWEDGGESCMRSVALIAGCPRGPFLLSSFTISECSSPFLRFCFRLVICEARWRFRGCCKW